jgi:type VI protein secretion system component VasF
MLWVHNEGMETNGGERQGSEALERAYGRFLELPVPVVLAVMWVVGVVLWGLCALLLYLYVSLLVQM